ATITRVEGEDRPNKATVLDDELHQRFRLPCPGTRSNAVRLPELILFNPTNTGTCLCALFIASLDVEGNLIGQTLELDPGKTQQLYEAEPGAVAIVAACAADCDRPDCFSELTIDIPVA